MFATKVPYDGGTHTCDVCLVKPVVFDGRVVAVSTTPLIEIGAQSPAACSR